MNVVDAIIEEIIVHNLITEAHKERHLESLVRVPRSRTGIAGRREKSPFCLFLQIRVLFYLRSDGGFTAPQYGGCPRVRLLPAVRALRYTNFF